MHPTLDKEISIQLHARRGDWPAIAMSSGVSHSWISKFVRGQIPNPGYTTLVRLATVLRIPVGVGGGPAVQGIWEAMEAALSRDSRRDVKASQLGVAINALAAHRVCEAIAEELLEEFPEASFELICDLLLRAIDGGAVSAGSTAALAGDGVAGLEVRVDVARVVERLASALRAGQGNRVAHGQPLPELIDVEERQSYPVGAGRQALGEVGG